MSKDKAPPLLSASKSYEDWTKLITLWKGYTSLDVKKQASAIVLSLDGKAQTAALEIPNADLIKDNGVETLIKKLDQIYLKDELSIKFDCVEKFENFKRKENTSVKEYVEEFERLYNKVKAHKIEYSEEILGFRLLKAADLPPRDEQLIKATITDFKLNEIKTKLSKIFSEGPSQCKQPSEEIKLKTEPTFHAECQDDNESDYTDEYTDYDGEYPDPENDQFDTYYANYKSFRNKKFSENTSQRRNYVPRYQNNNRRQDTPKRRSCDNSRATNPPDRTGRPTRCAICQSIYHWAAKCPEKKSDHSTLYVEDSIILHQSMQNTSDMKSLVAETWSSALLDCGASKTVCGTEWLEQYKQCLPQESLDKIETSESSSTFRFGDGKRVTSQKVVSLPAIIGHTEVLINTDVVDSDIPLLLSRDSMKKANMNLDFESDTMTAFGEKIPLINTISGHYAIPIAKPVYLANELENGSISNITLAVTEDKSNTEIAIKLHRQFAHASKEKLLNLVKNAGHPWCNNQNLKEEIKKVCNDCKTCTIYKKPPARPVVALPTASRFKDTVALDLKFYNGSILIHMIDHATRLSASSVIPNKKPETIVKHILKNFLQVYGQAKTFLSDNGGEFINQTFLEMCDIFGIVVKTTAAESPWSNGLIERHNLILANMLDKVIDDTGCSLEIAVAWCCNAKNSLQNVDGFSPFQLAIGCNPILPDVLRSDLPSLTNKPKSAIIAENLNALHKAREAFIQSENSEKIKRALSHPVRTSGDIKYINGDSVYYKRKDGNEWHGPAVVLGQDGQQVLVKHGGVYVRVHPCRLNPIKTAKFVENRKSSNQANKTSMSDVSNQPECESDEDDDTPAQPIQEVHEPSSPPSSEDPPQDDINSDGNADTTEPETRDRAVSDLCRQLENSFHEEAGSDVTGHTKASSCLNSDLSNTKANMMSNTGGLVQPGDFQKGKTSAQASNFEKEGHSNLEKRGVASIKIKGVDNPYSNSLSYKNSLPTSSNALREVKSNRTIRYKDDPNDENYVTAKVVSRAGKASQGSKYPTWWNIKTPDDKFSIDLSTVSDLCVVPENEVTLTSLSNEEITAKMQELDEWSKRDVYSEVSDEGQNTITLRWVMKDKVIGDGKTSIKARLCARGFQEEQEFRTDSPTCSREGIRTALTLIASNSWKLNSIDVKTAFLQGKAIERDVYVKPPKEANTNSIWKLKKCVYGLADASRYWYLKFREELIKLGATPCSLDQGIFMWYNKNGQLSGIAICFVDDVIWAGDDEFNSVIMSLRSIFHIGTENHSSFPFLGVNLKQLDDFSIEADQYDFIENISFIPITPEMKANVKQQIDENNRKLLRTALGQLNWIAGMTRPEISFYTCQISTHIKNATIAELLTTNKVIKFVKNSKGFIKFPKLDLKRLSVSAFTDASWNNLPNGGSQGGQIIFLKDANNSVSPIIWNSNRIKRVARSTLAAESLSLLEGCDSAFYISQLVTSILKPNEKIPVTAITDSDSLLETSATTKLVLDRRLRVEISAIREMCERDEIRLIWVDKKNQLADVLTKKGAPSHNIMNTIQCGVIHHVMYLQRMTEGCNSPDRS